MHLRDPELLRLVMAARGVTQAELATRARREDGGSCGDRFIGHLCRGYRRGASPGLAQSIAAALAVDVALLWEAPAAPLRWSVCQACGRAGLFQGDTPAAS